MTQNENQITAATRANLPLEHGANCLTEEMHLLHRIEVLTDSALNEIGELVNSTILSNLVREYSDNLKKREVDVGFNLFAIISEIYHRENLHSDILFALLDPDGGHREHEKYLQLFLEYIRAQGAKINLQNYSNPRVKREEGRIDLTIQDEKSKRAIIIENKINNAGDMPRQLPRYLDYVVNEKGYACDAIVYLRLNGKTPPDMTEWTPDEKTQVSSRLQIICAYDETNKDLLNGWILKCEALSNNSDAKHILRQYGGLIKKLGRNIMNKPIMEKFYNIMLAGENLKTALSLKAMLDDLVPFRVGKIIDKFKTDLSPFNKIANHQNYDAYFTGLLWNDAHFGIDVVVEPELYLFQFWDRKDRAGVRGHAKSILEAMNQFDKYHLREGGMYCREFSFPSQERDLVEHITDFKQKLAETMAFSAKANNSVGANTL